MIPNILVAKGAGSEALPSVPQPRQEQQQSRAAPTTRCNGLSRAAWRCAIRVSPNWMAARH